MPKAVRSTIWLYAITAFFLTACFPTTQEAPSPPTITPTPIQETEPTPLSEEPAAEEAQEEAAPAPVEESQSPALPPEPQVITFETSDGRTLEGMYYPGATNPSPVIVLMHWAPGTMNDWNAIAPWLQNRGLEGGTPGSNDFLDSTWFPVLPEDLSFAVLTFNFSGRGNSEGNRNSGHNLLTDAIYSLMAVSTLEGADKNRMATIGASIGADGAAEGCAQYNFLPNANGSCLGALSLSPGNYLGESYSEAVTGLANDDPQGIAYCLGAENDGPVAETCASASGDNYQSFIYLNSGLHGMDLWRPTIEPDTVSIVLDFLEEVFGVGPN